MERNETVDLPYENLDSNKKTLIEWYRKNPLSVYIEIALMAMADVGIITEEEYKKYKAEAEKKADILREYLGKRENKLS